MSKIFYVIWFLTATVEIPCDEGICYKQVVKEEQSMFLDSIEAKKFFFQKLQIPVDSAEFFSISNSSYNGVEGCFPAYNVIMKYGFKEGGKK